MTKFSTFIEDSVDSIVDEWEVFARTVGTVSAGLASQDLRDHAKVVLEAVAADMASEQDPAQQHQKSLGSSPASGQSEVVRKSRMHAEHRFEQGFTLSEMVSEYRALRASVIRRWVAQLGAATPAQLAELTRFGEAIDEGLTESIAWYSKRLEDSRNLLVGALAHDLRNPLTAVKLSAQYLLRTDRLSDAELRAVTRIAASTARMTKYVSDLLDFTQTLLGASLPISRAHTDLTALCEDVVDELQAANPLARIELDADDAVTGAWDPSRLSQMLGNLLANAIIHGDTSEPVTIRLRSSDTKTTIGVHNMGKPIPQSARPTLFQPLMQARHGTERRGGASGLGLGLYIAREIAMAHGGSIKLHSEASAGTTFTVELPSGPSDPGADGQHA